MGSNREKRKLDMNLVLSSWLCWEAGELLDERDRCHIFRDRGDAAACFLSQVERIANAVKKEITTIRMNPHMEFTTGYSCTVFWFQVKAKHGDDAETCLRKFAREIQSLEDQGLDGEGRLEELLVCYDGSTYEPKKKALPLKDAIESLAEAFANG